MPLGTIMFPARAKTNEFLTFQAVLYADGYICLNYDEIDDTVDTMTVGIEDSDGWDGFGFTTNQAELSSDLSVCYERPGDISGRVKVFPIWQGGFVESSVHTFTLNLRNTGDTTNYYDFEAVLIDPAIPVGNWTATFYDGDGVALVDSEADICGGCGDGKVDTGYDPEMASGATIPILVRIETDAPTAIGDYSVFEITAESNAGGGNSGDVVVYLQTSVTAPFAQVFTDSNLGDMQLKKSPPEWQ